MTFVPQRKYVYAWSRRGTVPYGYCSCCLFWLLSQYNRAYIMHGKGYEKSRYDDIGT